MSIGPVRGVVVALLLGVTAAAQTPAGQPPPQPPTFRTGVGAVRVDVTVIGKDGLPVLDLTRDDFEVREDGVVQNIQLFQPYRLTGLPAESSDESLTIRSADHARQEAGREDVRLLVIFLDDYHLKWGPLDDTRIKNNLVRFIQTELRPMDLVAVMGPLTPLSDLRLTRDRSLLLERVNSLQGRLGGFVPPRSVVEESHLRLSAGQLMRVRAQISLSALEAITVHLSGLREGRKSILFVSQGPPIGAESEIYGRLTDVIVAANRGNVTIHTLDPRQLGDARRMSDANVALSADTGGRRMGQTNDVTKALKGVMADASMYYMLGYESAHTNTDGKFREIDVRLRNGHGNRVIARKGYWAPKAQEVQVAAAAAAAASRVDPEIAAAFESLRDQSRRLAVIDWMGHVPAEDGHSDVSIVLEALAAGPTAPKIGAIEIDVTAADGAKALYVPTREPSGAWTLKFSSPAGTVKTRVVVKDTEGQVLDTWARDLQVPRGDVSPSIGTPTVFRAASVVQYRALASGAPVSPTPVRTFRRTDRAIFRLPIRANRVPVDVQLLNRQGTPLQTLKAVQAPVPDAVQVEVPLGNLAQADYLLRFLVGIGQSRTTRVVPFTLAP